MLFLLAKNFETWYALAYGKDEKQISFKELKHFLLTCPKWPQEERLIEKAEKFLEVSSPHLKEWFHVFQPRSIKACHLYMKVQPIEEQSVFARYVWQTKRMNEKEQKEWFKKYRKYLNAKSHMRRLDFLCVQGLRDDIERFADVVPSLKDEVQIRLNLLNQKKVCFPTNPSRGVMLCYLNYLKAQEDFEAMAQILKDFHRDQNTFAEQWVYIRLRVAKEMVQMRNYKLAYQVLDSCSLRSCAAKNDLIMLKAIIAIHCLKIKPKSLIEDVECLYGTAKVPHIKSMSAFYMGILTNEVEWYQKATEHSTTFFGLKALKHLKSKAPAFIKACEFKKQNDLIKTLFALPKDSPHIIPFIQAVVARDLKNYDQGCGFLQKIADHFGAPYMIWAEMFVRKKFAKTPKLRCLYPTLPEVRDSFHLGLIRQESLFDKNARSCANALGYMQLILPTAERVSGQKLTEKEILDPKTNLLIGRKYLLQLDQEFNGMRPLMLAAYNAGEHRVHKWIEFYDYPATAKECERFMALIPFKETHYYVHQVLANEEVYREILKSRV